MLLTKNSDCNKILANNHCKTICRRGWSGNRWDIAHLAFYLLQTHIGYYINHYLRPNFTLYEFDNYKYQNWCNIFTCTILHHFTRANQTLSAFLNTHPLDCTVYVRMMQCTITGACTMGIPFVYPNVFWKRGRIKMLYRPQWQIQDFPEKGAPTPQGGRQHTILPHFPKNCMKLKESGPQGAVFGKIRQNGMLARPGELARVISATGSVKSLPSPNSMDSTVRSISSVFGTEVRNWVKNQL